MATPINILMVEDCELDATLLVRELEKAHFEPTWKRVQTETEYRANLAPGLDVILSDFSVPGFPTQLALKALQETKLDIPFIIVSGMIDEEHVVESLKAGATDFVAKDRLTRIGPVVRRALRETAERSDRKYTERQLRLVSFAVNQVREAAFLVDDQGRFAYVNDEACRASGYSRGELLNLPITDLVHDFSAEQWPGVWFGIVKRHSMTCERLFRTKDGHSVLVEVAANYFEHDGRGFVLGLVRDVTERKRAEEALRESENRFRQVTESIDEVFWLTDTAKNQMIYISPAYERIWGRSCASLYATPRSWMDAIHPEDRERVQNAALTLQAARAYDVEYRIVRLDGSTRWIHDRAFPIKDASGRVYRVAGVAEDITSRRQLEAQFRHAQKMEAVGQLAAGVAHDFNNLLAVMRGNAELVLLNLAQHGSQTEECLKQITAAAERAASLTRQLLVFSRKQAMRSQPLSLNDVISNLTRMLKRIIGEHIEMQSHCALSLPFIEGDAAMLEQVLMNLVVNARDAMPSGGRIHIATDKLNLEPGCEKHNPEARAGEFVCLLIRDTGSGIPLEDLPHIFEPFFTTKEPGKGTGLGLATVYGIVKQHQGWIEVSSLLGKGTAFKIFLPAIPRPLNPAALANTEPALRGGSETVLVVEDDSAVRMITRRSLESFGYTVYEASSAREALECWRNHGPEIALLLTDLVMPGGTGRELARQLQAQNPRLKVIFITGYSAQAAAKDTAFLQGPITNLLQKPFSTRDLILRVRECMDSSAAGDSAG
jgi:two-component system cell cycle sensor histidine kinase/response regulator CckA